MDDGKGKKKEDCKAIPMQLSVDTSFMKQRLALDDRPTRILSKKVNNWLTTLPTESTESSQVASTPSPVETSQLTR